MTNTNTKQAHKRCTLCKRKTLHIATIKKADMGCGFMAGNLLLCVITLGLWLPIFVLSVGLGTFGNSVAPLGAKFHCQVCGSRYGKGNALAGLALLMVGIAAWIVYRELYRG